MSLKNRASFALQSKKIRLPIVLLVAVLAVLPMVSSLDWDNVKTYDKETKTITIKNALGLGKKFPKPQGFLKGDKPPTLSPHRVCFVNTKINFIKFGLIYLSIIKRIVNR